MRATATDGAITTVIEEDAELGDQGFGDGLNHFFETCCTQPNFRTLCGKSIILTRKPAHTDGKGGNGSLCVVCETIAKTPYYCRKCGRQFVLP